MDIDLLLYDRLILETEDLVLPHPRMAVRRFVLEPACEIAADMIHAPTGWTLSRLLGRLDEPLCYVAVTGATATTRTEIVTAAAAARQARLLCFAPREHRATAPTSRGASHGTLQRELDAVAQQAHLLSSIGASRASQPASLVISNFWLSQALAVARNWPASANRQRLQQACREALARAPQPKFVLFLDAPWNSRVGRDLGTPDIPASALRDQIAQPGQCPYIRVAGADIDLAVIELTAAVDAMQ